MLVDYVAAVKARLKLVLVIMWLSICYVPAWVSTRLGKKAWRDRVARVFCKGMLWLLGVKLTVKGALHKQTPLLLVTNHISYLDIILLSACNSVRFTPKSEIEAWPVIGGICKMMDAIFIDRKPERVKEMQELVLAKIDRGEVVCLFPEATTGDGLHMQPFKSGFFNLAEMPLESGELTIQPAAIIYTHIHKLPIGRTQWPHIAWYGDMELAPHLMQFLRLGRVDVQLHFLEPVKLSGLGGGRKNMAAHCQQAIGQTIEEYKK